MSLRRLVRGQPSWPAIETVVRSVVERYDHAPAHVRFLAADNWLSTPVVIDDSLFVKIISQQNTLVHALFTTGRNLGAVASGTAGFFESFQSPAEMAQHEVAATKKMRALGLNAPEPIEAFETEGYGVVVFEYLPAFRPLDALDPETESWAPEALFAALHTLHDAGLAHGDLRAENVLLLDDKLYFIDATSVDSDAQNGIRSYDIACALAALEPIIGARAAVAAAEASYQTAELLSAADFLHFVQLRPDHDFAAAGVRSEIEHRATAP